MIIMITIVVIISIIFNNNNAHLIFKRLINSKLQPLHEWLLEQIKSGSNKRGSRVSRLS